VARPRVHERKLIVGAAKCRLWEILQEWTAKYGYDMMLVLLAEEILRVVKERTHVLPLTEFQRAIQLWRTAANLTAAEQIALFAEEIGSIAHVMIKSERDRSLVETLEGEPVMKQPAPEEFEINVEYANCVGFLFGEARAAAPPDAYRCCPRAGEYNGFGSDGPTTFTCPNHCSCHD